MSNGSLSCAEVPLSSSRIIPPDIAEIFGEPPVLGVENRQAYDTLLTQLALEWKPRNITEWIFVRDIADISWEIFRHRRAIGHTFAISSKQALAGILNDLLPGTASPAPGSSLWYKRREQVETMADAWFRGPKERAKVKSQLAKYGVSPEAIVAQSYQVRGDELDKLHRLLALAEARRDAVTRNFNEYRAVSSLREKPIIDAEEVALVPNSG